MREPDGLREAPHSGPADNDQVWERAERGRAASPPRDARSRVLPSVNLPEPGGRDKRDADQIERETAKLRGSPIRDNSKIGRVSDTVKRRGATLRPQCRLPARRGDEPPLSPQRKQGQKSTLACVAGWWAIAKVTCCR